MLTPEEKFRRLTCNRAIRDDIRQRSLRAALSTGTSSAIDFSLRLGSTAVLARLLSPEQFGLIMMVTAVTIIADQVREMGLSTATVQAPEVTHARATNLFWICLGIGAAIAGLLCAASPLLAHFYREPRLVAITCALSSTFVFGGLMTQHQALLTRQLKLGHTSAIRLGASFLSTALAIYLAASDFGVWSLVLREIARSALMTAGMWLCFPWRPGLPQSNTSVRDMIGFGVDLTGANLIASIAGASDRLLLGRFWGSASVALYRQAYQLLLIPMDQLLSPLFQVSQPSLSLLQNDPDRYRRFFLKLIMMVCLVTMPVSIFIALYASELTLLLLGRKWLDCAPLLLLLSFATFIRQPIGFTAVALLTRGKSRAYLRLVTTQQCLLFVCLCIGTAWGPRGVAIAEVTATYLLAAPALHLALSGAPVALREVLAIYARVGGVSLAMGGALLFYRSIEVTTSTIATLVTGAGVAASVFLALWLLLPTGRRESLELLRDLRETLLRRSSREIAAAEPSLPVETLTGARPVAPKA